MLWSLVYSHDVWLSKDEEEKDPLSKGYTRLLRVPSIVLLDSIIMIRGIEQTNCPLLRDVLEKTDNIRMFDVQITNWYGKDRLEISVLHPKKLEEGLQQRLI